MGPRTGHERRSALAKQTTPIKPVVDHVLVRFRNASFCVECKREQDDATRDGLRTYAGQAAVYTDTDAAFGILLALDLTVPASGAPDLFSPRARRRLSAGTG